MNFQKILITGASRGIGAAVAEVAAQRGMTLHLVARSVDANLVARLKLAGAKAVHCYEADLSDAESTRQLINKIQNLNIDILFNNAGLLTGGLFEKQNMEEIRRMIVVNVTSLIELTQVFLPRMLEKKSGLIVNNASVSGIMYFPCASTYAASKAAVVAFTQSLERELIGSGVKTLLLITPGIKTKMFDEIAVKYGGNLKMDLDSISTEQYANLIFKAIDQGRSELWPQSFKVRTALSISKYFPSLFTKISRATFKRN